MRTFSGKSKILGGVLVAGLLAAACGPASAQTHLGGSVGADLGIYGFENSLFTRPQDYSAERGMSNQFLDFNMIGPFFDQNLANYNARIRVRGTQIRSDTDEEKKTEYINPHLTNYYGGLALFPNRRFPMMFYTGRTTDNSVRYEAANRGEVDLLDPGLAVLRRYQTETEGTGAQLRFLVNPDLQLDFEAKTTKNIVERQYDFDENRNIWVDMTTVSPGVSPFYNVEVVNTIPDNPVLLFVDFAFVDTVQAGETLSLVIEEGIRDLDFVPVGLNSYRQRIDLRSDMIWKIFYSDPPGSKDMDQSNDIITGRLTYGGEGKFTNVALFEINDGREQVQRMITGLKKLNNLATYRLTPNTTLTSLTDLTDNLTDVSDISSQRSKSIQQQTAAKWRQPGRIAASLTHQYADLTSETGVDAINSRNNIVNGAVIVPTHWNQHEASLVLGANLLKDSRGQVNNQYTSELKNHLELRGAGFRWKPRHMLKLSNATRQNPDGESGELDSRLMVEAENPRLGKFGALRFKVEYDYKNRTNGEDVSVTNKYLGDVSLSKRFGPATLARLSYGWEKHTFDNRVQGVDPGDIPIVPAREDERRTSLRADFQAQPWNWLNFGGMAMWITTNESNITKYSASLQVKIPKINLPIRSFAIKERRELENIRPQEIFQVETKVGYNFRRIRMSLAHRYTDETLITENYKYGEFLVEITRDFDVF